MFKKISEYLEKKVDGVVISNFITKSDIRHYVEGKIVSSFDDCTIRTVQYPYVFVELRKGNVYKELYTSDRKHAVKILFRWRKKFGITSKMLCTGQKVVDLILAS